MGFRVPGPEKKVCEGGGVACSTNREGKMFSSRQAVDGSEKIRHEKTKKEAKGKKIPCDVKWVPLLAGIKNRLTEISGDAQARNEDIGEGTVVGLSF